MLMIIKNLFLRRKEIKHVSFEENSQNFHKNIKKWNKSKNGFEVK